MSYSMFNYEVYDVLKAESTARYYNRIVCMLSTYCGTIDFCVFAHVIKPTLNNALKYIELNIPILYEILLL